MVNNIINVSSYEEHPPEKSGEKRIYIEGPLYSVDDVMKILKQGDLHMIPWTKDCKNDLQKHTLDISDARQLVHEAITSGQYLNSQWCVQKPTGPWAACDGYRLFRDEWIEYAHKYMRIEYYIKFAIGKTGKLLLLVSCHT